MGDAENQGEGSQGSADSTSPFQVGNSSSGNTAASGAATAVEVRAPVVTSQVEVDID